MLFGLILNWQEEVLCDMRILVVASYNKGRFAPFIREQVVSLQAVDCEIEYFGLQGKGLDGYLKNLPALKQKIKSFRPDVIHAHYGLSGLFANLQRKVPVVVTYHGSDINEKTVLKFSKMAMRFAAWNIFVSKKTLNIVNPKRKYTLLPCGIDMSDLQLTSKAEARQRMHLDEKKKYILFAGAFGDEVKNVPLARKSIEALDVELIELHGYARDEVTLLMCGVDALLMTSFTEGSPQVIKEALACGCPIVSVDVGDVRERMEGVDGCYVAETRNPEELSALLRQAIVFDGKTSGRNKVVADGLDNRQIAVRLIEIYKKVCLK